MHPVLGAAPKVSPRAIWRWAIAIPRTLPFTPAEAVRKVPFERNMSLPERFSFTPVLNDEYWPSAFHVRSMLPPVDGAQVPLHVESSQVQVTSVKLEPFATLAWSDAVFAVTLKLFAGNDPKPYVYVLRVK